MPKKNLRSGESASINNILGYRLPVYHDTQSGSYVDFYCFDPIAGGMRRKKYHLDKYKSKRERKLQANVIITTITNKLLSGWNYTTAHTLNRCI